MADKQKTLGELLDDYMWGHRIKSPAKLADRLGFSAATIYAWMNGSRKPELSSLAIVSEKTGIPLRDLLLAAGHAVPDSPTDALDYALDHVDEEFRDFDEAARQRIKEGLRRARDASLAGVVVTTADDRKTGVIIGAGDDAAMSTVADEQASKQAKAAQSHDPDDSGSRRTPHTALA